MYSVLSVPGTIQAVQHVRRMRGGAQSHLMRAADGHYYVVKFQNNPQHRRVLANELLATRLAEHVGLSVPGVRVIEVDPWLIAHTPELVIELAGRTEPCAPGLQFASRFVLDPFAGQVLDYLPDEALDRVANLGEFAGMLCIDKWTGNTNGRQAVFAKRHQQRLFRAIFIDQGYCFNAGEWNFIDSPLRGVYARNRVYASVAGWQSFEPWLERIEQMTIEALADCAEGLPPEWYGDPDDLERLLLQLHERRSKVRALTEAFRESTRQPFPSWTMKAAAVQ
jgi:hypothetical protein